jgi:pimeloyl-ACP methyl ester carboxylesterase
MDETLEIRVQGSDRYPTLIYLPGTHGDWTLVGSFRRALGDRIRFVEISYPRTVSWSLDEHAAAIEAGLAERGIRSAWVLGESFGSQVVWALLKRNRFSAQGIVLAGGFVRHPTPWAVRLAEQLVGGIPLTWIQRGLWGYAKLGRFRYRRSPEVLGDLQQFLDRRSLELDREAARHRLHLIAESDFCDLARRPGVPLYVLSGLWDPIVPWFWVRRWLRQNCVNLREYRILAGADHNVLGTAPGKAAEIVLGWIASASSSLIRATRP